jgi:multidrug efflux pump subunit AcrA (membrane-fusion protein)
VTRARTARWLLAAFIVAAAGAGAFWLRQAGVGTGASFPTAEARRGEFLVIAACRGELAAGRSVQLTAPLNVPDLRIVWTVQPGASVKAGDPIVRFDASSAQRQLQEKEAALRQSQAQLEEATAQSRIAIEQSRLELARLRTAAERARLEASKGEILSALVAEEKHIDYGLAREKLKVQEAADALTRTQNESKISSIRSQVEKNQAEVDLTNKRLSQMELRSPSNGVVNFMMNYSQGWMNAKPFKVGDSAWPGSAIAEIPDLSSLSMKARVEETDRGRIRPGQEARVHLDPFPEKVFPATLETISALAEQGFEWPPARNFRAFARFHEIDPRLRPAMNGRLDIIVDRLPDAVSVPAKAVFARDGRPVVLVPSAEGLKPVRVEVLARNPDEVAVRGIEGGTRVALVEPGKAEPGKEEKKK